MNISPTGWAMKRKMIFTSHHDAPVAAPAGLVADGCVYDGLFQLATAMATAIATR
jgi:hypothetical protein